MCKKLRHGFPESLLCHSIRSRYWYYTDSRIDSIENKCALTTRRELDSIFHEQTEMTTNTPCRYNGSWFNITLAKNAQWPSKSFRSEASETFDRMNMTTDDVDAFSYILEIIRPRHMLLSVIVPWVNKRRGRVVDTYLRSLSEYLIACSRWHIINTHLSDWFYVSVVSVSSRNIRSSTTKQRCWIRKAGRRSRTPGCLGDLSYISRYVKLFIRRGFWC